MSAKQARCRILGKLVMLSLGFMLVGCTGDMDDPGAKRTQQQSEELQNRIRTTQIDR